METFVKLIETRHKQSFDQFAKWLAKQIKEQFALTFDLQIELDWIRSTLRKSNEPLVFCHNDLNVNTFLWKHNTLTEQESQLLLINYDLCAFNYRAFEFAHFLNTVYLERYQCSPDFNLSFDANVFACLRQQLLDSYASSIQQLQSKVNSNNRPELCSTLELNEIVRFQSVSTLISILLILATQLQPEHRLPVSCKFTFAHIITLTIFKMFAFCHCYFLLKTGLSFVSSSTLFKTEREGRKV